MMKLIYALILVFGACLTGNAQSIFIHLVDGNTETYPLIDVRSITFSDNVMNVNLITQDTISWNTSVITYYEYYQPPMSVVSPMPLSGAKVNVFPNPSTGPVTIEYELLEKAKVSIDVFDMKGTLIERLSDDIETEGRHTKQWDPQSSGVGQSAGIYLCKLTIGNLGFNKLIILSN